MGVVQGIETIPADSEDDNHDDTDVPSSAIILDALDIVVIGADDQASDCIVRAAKDKMTGGLIAADEEENVWAWNNGEKWGDELPVDENED
jgi:hypothetical protein